MYRQKARFIYGGRNLTTSTNQLINFPKKHPFAFSLALSTLNPTAADLLTQTFVEQRSNIDWQRTTVFGSFGFFYLGCVQWLLMVNVYRVMFPTMDRFARASFAEKLKDTAGAVGAVKQVAFDIFFHLPFMYFPVFYTMKETIQGGSGSAIDIISAGLCKYKQNFWDDAKALILVWGPADVVVFGLVPMWMRLPVRNLVSFGWTSYLSLKRGGEGQQENIS